MARLGAGSAAESALPSGSATLRVRGTALVTDSALGRTSAQAALSDDSAALQVCRPALVTDRAQAPGVLSLVRLSCPPALVAAARPTTGAPLPQY